MFSFGKALHESIELQRMPLSDGMRDNITHYGFDVIITDMHSFISIIIFLSATFSLIGRCQHNIIAHSEH